MKDRIAEFREKNGLTQTQLANMCGVSQQSISKVEKGNGLPSLKLASAIANALGCTMDELFETEKEVG